MSIDDYPYDPSLPLADLSKARGLEKLRWVEDPAVRESLYRLFFVACRNSDPVIAAEIERQRIDAEVKRLQQLASKALTGKLGDIAKRTAEDVLRVDPRTGKHPDDHATLRNLARAIKDVRNPEPEGGFDAPF